MLNLKNDQIWFLHNITIKLNTCNNGRDNFADFRVIYRRANFLQMAIF